MKRIAINGFGRIGRLAFRAIAEINDLEVIAINDLTPAEDLAYLLKHDTVHRNFDVDVISHSENELIYKDKNIKIFNETDPVNLPWRELNIDIVLECTGKFTKFEDANKHVEAGAKKVLISAPGKGDMKTIVYNVNHDLINGEEKVISAASCTTNCLAPVLNLLEKNFGIVKGYMTTVHAYTNDQTTLDIPHKKGIYARRGRAAAQNIIPSTTGAASAIGLVIPSLKGKLNGGAFRVPVSDGSLIDVTLELAKNTDKEELNNLFKNNQNETIKYTDEPIVSSDILGSTCGSLVDGLLTDVIEVEDKQLIKVVAWYDNEYGYTCQMIRTMQIL